MKYTLQYDRRAMNFMIETWGGANSIFYENEQPGAVLGTYRGSELPDPVVDRPCLTSLLMINNKQ